MLALPPGRMVARFAGGAGWPTGAPGTGVVVVVVVPSVCPPAGATAQSESASTRPGTSLKRVAPDGAPLDLRRRRGTRDGDLIPPPIPPFAGGSRLLLAKTLTELDGSVSERSQNGRGVASPRGAPREATADQRRHRRSRAGHRRGASRPRGAARAELAAPGRARGDRPVASRRRAAPRCRRRGSCRGGGGRAGDPGG